MNSGDPLPAKGKPASVGGTTKVLLLGGTSHTGKSTLGARLASDLGWRHLSTDQLARHPGRPWKDDGSRPPDDVVSYYTSHSPAQLLEDVVRHYRENVWPTAEALIRSHLNNPFDPSLVLDGSAILPELVVDAQLPAGCAAVWLTGDEHLVRERIHESSRFDTRRPDERELIEAFVERSLLFDDLVSTTADRLGGERIDAASSEALHLLRRALGERGG